MNITSKINVHTVYLLVGKAMIKFFLNPHNYNCINSCKEAQVLKEVSDWSGSLVQRSETYL